MCPSRMPCAGVPASDGPTVEGSGCYISMRLAAYGCGPATQRPDVLPGQVRDELLGRFVLGAGLLACAGMGEVVARSPVTTAGARAVPVGAAHATSRWMKRDPATDRRSWIAMPRAAGTDQSRVRAVGG